MPSIDSKHIGLCLRLREALRPPQNPLLPSISIEHLRALRVAELDLVTTLVAARGRLLEIGAGRGWQAAALAAAGFDVKAIDVAPTDARVAPEWPVTYYDGRTIPFSDKSFDFVFSSNTLEHIPDRIGFQAEIRRVLKEDGVAIHIVPSATWRIWTNLAFPLRYFFAPLRHGEDASNAWSEIGEFREGTWRRHFVNSGWSVEHHASTGLFYTGCSIADHHLSIQQRRALSSYLGSACHVFILRKTRAKTGYGGMTPNAW